MWWLSSSSSSWLSCSSSTVLEPTSSVPVAIQWLRFVLLSPCPQRALFSSVDLLFLLCLALHKLFAFSSSSVTNGDAEIRKPLIGNHGRIPTRTTAWFKTTVVVTVLLSFCSVVLCVLAFTAKRRTQRPWNLIYPLFWLIHAVTYVVIAVLVLHEKRFSALNHTLSLRIYWISSFVLTTLFAVSGIFHFISDVAVSLREEDVASFFSFPLTAFLLIASVRGTTGLVTAESNSSTKPYDAELEKSNNVSLYASASVFSKMFWLWMNPLLSKGYKSPLNLH